MHGFYKSSSIIFVIIFNNKFVCLPSIVISPYKGVKVISLPFHRKNSPVVVLSPVRQGVVILQSIDDKVVRPRPEAESGNKLIIYFNRFRMFGQSLIEVGLLVLS